MGSLKNRISLSGNFIFVSLMVDVDGFSFDTNLFRSGGIFKWLN